MVQLGCALAPSAGLTPAPALAPWLQDVTTAGGQRALASPDLLARAQGGQAPLLLPLEEVSAAFWGAEQGPGADMRRALADGRSPDVYKDLPKVLVTEADVAPWWTFFLLCAGRQFTLLKRDLGLLQGRVMQVGCGRGGAMAGPWQGRGGTAPQRAAPCGVVLRLRPAT